MGRIVAFAVMQASVLVLIYSFVGMLGAVGGLCGIGIATGAIKLISNEWPWE